MARLATKYVCRIGCLAIGSSAVGCGDEGSAGDTTDTVNATELTELSGVFDTPDSTSSAPLTSPPPGGAGAGGAPSPSGQAGTGGLAAGDGAVEVAEPDIVFASPDTIAERLARMIWDGRDAEDVRALLGIDISRQSVGEVAEAMLADERAREGVAAFYRWWLYFGTEVPADQSDPLSVARHAEAPAVGTYLTLDADGTFADLLTASFTFMNETLAEVYGVDGVVGSELRLVPYPPSEPRIGLLTGAGVLSFYSSVDDPPWPVKRGWLVTDPLLCKPTVRMSPAEPPPDPAVSIRQQMIDVTSGSACISCHQMLNSPGFAFIGFDTSGRWRPEPGAAQNETQGWIPEEIMPGAPQFDGPSELAHLLLEREETRRCFVRQWMQFSLDPDEPVSHETAPEDVASVEVALRAFVESDLRLSSAIVAVARTNTFLR